MNATSRAADPRAPVVILFDVDNTLLDNDAVQQDFRSHRIRSADPVAADHYWTIFEELRSELGYADYLGALQRYRLHHLQNPRLLFAASYLLEYPFAERLYPRALKVLAQAGHLGRTAILSDGDVVFQPRKIERAGLRCAVEDRVLIYIHKERELERVAHFHPADHYFLIDDKLPILAAVKRIWGKRITTIFVRHGHYAFDPEILVTAPPADVSIAVSATCSNTTWPRCVTQPRLPPAGAARAMTTNGRFHQRRFSARSVTRWMMQLHAGFSMRVSDAARAVVLFLIAAATIGGAFLAINLHLANGAAHPWLIPSEAFDEGIDLDSVLPAIQVVIAAVSLVMLRRLRQQPVPGE